MNKHVLWILFLFIVLSLAACQTSPGVLEVEVQPATSAEPDQELLSEIRPVVRAITGGTVTQRKALIEFLNTPCTRREGLGGPPPCAEGEDESTLVQVFPVLESEGYFLRPEEIELGLQYSVKGLYAVYQQIPNPEPQPYWPSGGYVLIFDREQNDFPIPVTVLVQDGRIVHITHHSGVTPEEILETVPVDQVILPPARARALNPPPIAEEPTSEPGAIDFSAIPAPLDWPIYRNENLGYQISYQPDWIVEKHGLSQTTKEVIFNPPYPEDFKVALSVALDQRPLDVIQQVYADHQPEAISNEMEFAGEQSIMYRFPWGRVEIFILHQNQVYVVSTDYGDQTEYLQALGSFRFTDWEKH